MVQALRIASSTADGNSWRGKSVVTMPLVVLFALLALTLGMPSAAQQRSDTISQDRISEDRISLTGTVVDDKGEGLSGVRVLARPTESPYDEGRYFLTGQRVEPVAEDRTGAGGSFSLDVPKPGFWTLHFVKQGFGRARILPYTPYFESTHSAPIELAPMRRMTLEVSNERGEAISGATVQAHHPGYLDVFSKANRSTRVRGDAVTDKTNAEGIAALDLLPIRGQILVAAPGYLPSTLQVQAKTSSAAVVLEQAAMQPLQLSLSNGEPASEAVVFVTGIAAAIADETGRAEVPVPVNGSHVVKILHRSLESAETELARSNQRRSLQLDPPTRISGRVLDATTREAIAGAWVFEFRSHPTTTKAQSDEGSSERTSAVTYSLETPAILVDSHHRGAARQSHYLAASAPGYFGVQTSPSDVDFQGGKGPSLELERYAKVTGRVVDHRGRAASGVALSAVALDGRGGFSISSLSPADPAAVSGRDGSFELTPIIEGVETRVDARARGFATTSVKAPALEPGATTELEIQLIRGNVVVGQVVDEASVPIAGATVTIAKTREGGMQLSELVSAQISRDKEEWSAITDLAGSFQFIDFAPGHYDVVAKAPTYAPAQVRTVEISSDPTSDAAPRAADASATDAAPVFEVGVLALSPGAVLQGVVKDPSGRNLEGAEVVLESDPGSVSMSFGPEEDKPTVFTDDAGRFEFDSLQPSATYSLGASKHGYAETGLGSVVVPTEKPAELVMEPAVDLAGRVLNEAGAPVQQARISASIQSSNNRPTTQADFRSSRRSQTADSNGAFVLENLKQGDWTITVSANGYIAKSTEPIPIDPERTPAAQTIRLEKGATLEGRITGPDGEGVTGATVGQLHTMDARTGRPLRGSKSDADGSYLIEGLELGSKTFGIEAKGFQTALRDFEVKAGSNRLDVTLERGIVVSGTVFGPDGEPLAGALLNAVPGASRRFFVANPREGELSAADGTFELQGLDPGSYRLMASKEGLPVTTLEEGLVLESADVSGIELYFQNGTAIVGTVSGLDFDELAQVQLFAWASDRSGSPLLGKPDFEGKFRLDNATPGQWTVNASLGSTRSQDESVEIAEGDSEVTVDFEFNQGLTLTGLVLREGAPAPQVRVLMKGNVPNAMGTAVTDQDGSFIVHDLEPGEYELTAGTSAMPSHKQIVQLDGDREITIELAEQTVNVRVVDDLTGAPLAGIQVAIGSVDFGVGPQFSTFNRTVTNAAGRHTFARIGPGPAIVQAQGDGYGAVTEEIQVEASGVPTEVELRLPPSARLTVLLTDSLGNPLRSGYLTVLDGGGQALVTRAFDTAEGGRLVVNDVASGTWTFLFSDTAGATVRKTLTVVGRADEADGTGGNSAIEHVAIPVSGNLGVDTSAMVAAGKAGILTVLDSSGQLYIPANFPRLREREVMSGFVPVNELPVGTYTLQLAAKDGSESWTQTATVTANTTSTVVVQ